MLAFISITFVATLLIGMPIAFGLGLAGASWILFFEGLDPAVIVRRTYYALGAFPLLSIPLFIMIGFLAERAGMLPHMVRWLQGLLAPLRGGMAYVNVMGSMLFAGVSGTAVSDVASLGRLELQIMMRAGYPLPYSAALTAVSSIAGPIIPPSVAMVIYALAAGQVSIGGLFMAGAIPGFLICAGLIVMSWFHARRHNYEIGERPALRPFIVQTLKIAPLLLLPVIVVGGIIAGVFTVTESAAIGVVYTVIAGFIVTRELRVKDIYDSIIYAGIVSSVLGMLMSAGVIVSWIFTRNRVTQELAEFLSGVTADPTMFLGLCALALILLGMIMDATAIIIALAPLLSPVAMQYGIDPLQFGLVFVLSAMIGLATPPVGIVLFMMASIASISIESLSRAVLPFIAWLFCVVVIVVTVPAVTLWLPRALGY